MNSSFCLVPNVWISVGDVQYADGLRNPKADRGKESPGSQSSEFWVTDSLRAPAVSHYQNLPMNNEIQQWHSRQAANTAHGSVLSCRSWWDNGALILYIQVNVLCFVFFSSNLIKSQLSSLQGLKALCTDNKAQTSGQAHRHRKSPSVSRGGYTPFRCIRDPRLHPLQLVLLVSCTGFLKPIWLDVGSAVSSTHMHGLRDSKYLWKHQVSSKTETRQGQLYHLKMCPFIGF